MQALRGRPLTVYGDGKQTRSLCYISDLVTGIIRLLGSRINAPVNLGNPHEVTILELAGLIRRLAGGKSKLLHKPLPVDDPKVRCPDISIARRSLKWTPRVPLEEGLRRTIEYFKTAK
jgi:UDP-glucuronate decarboxylase